MPHLVPMPLLGALVMATMGRMAVAGGGFCLEDDPLCSDRVEDSDGMDGGSPIKLDLLQRRSAKVKAAPHLYVTWNVTSNVTGDDADANSTDAPPFSMVPKGVALPPLQKIWNSRLGQGLEDHVRSIANHTTIFYKVGQGTYGSDSCPCVGLDRVAGETSILIDGLPVSYPADVGAHCAAWDDGVSPECLPGAASPPASCTQQWCYVDPCNCFLEEKPKKSIYMAGTYDGHPMYFSAATCLRPQNKTAATTAMVTEAWTAPANASTACIAQATEAECLAQPECLWPRDRSLCNHEELVTTCDEPRPEMQVVGRDDCRCIGIAGKDGKVNTTINGSEVDYPGDVGSYCNTWDKNVHPECLADFPPDWCESKWCYVDSCNCATLVPARPSELFKGISFQGNPAFYSYQTCDFDDSYTEDQSLFSCPNQKSEVVCKALSPCVWQDEQCRPHELVNVCDRMPVGVAGYQNHAFHRAGAPSAVLAAAATLALVAARLRVQLP